MTMGVALAVQLSQPGNTLPLDSANKAPAKPANAPLMTKAASWCACTSTPTHSTRRGFERSARSVKPKGECTRRYSTYSAGATRASAK